MSGGARTRPRTQAQDSIVYIALRIIARSTECFVVRRGDVSLGYAYALSPEQMTSTH